jgi:hypothetical protein
MSNRYTPPARTHRRALLAAYTFLRLTHALLSNDDNNGGVKKRAMYSFGGPSPLC